MDLVLLLLVVAACILGSFLGALMGVQMTDRYYQRQSDNKLYGTVFSGPPEPPEPIGDRLLTPEEYQELMEEQSNQDCDSPEPKKTTGTGWPPPPPAESEGFSGWRDNFEAGIYNADKKEPKPLPGSLGTGR